MSKIFKKAISLILILLLLPISLTGCEDATAIENLAYVTAIGFDIGTDNVINLTLQFAELKSTEQSGSSQPESSTLVSIDCSSFDAGITIINSYISKKINLAHCKVIVFSEALAINGISNYMNTLTSNLEIRPDCTILISKCDAKLFLEDSQPTLTSITARYYEILLNSREYTGFSDNTPLWKFFINLKNTTKEPTAVLCGINTSYLNKNILEKSLMDRDLSYEAGETPIKTSTQSQNLGLAVFSEDKLVGELNGIECICYLILTNSLETCNISIPNPFENNSTVTIKLKLKRNTKNNVNIVNDSPFIESNVFLNGSITSINQSAEYSKTEHLRTIEEYASSYMETALNLFLYKTAKYLKADIVGFSENIIPNYIDINDWKNLRWESLYRNSFFKVNVKITIKSESLFIKN